MTSLDVIHARNDARAVSVNIKLSRVGGITNAVRMRDLLQELNMLVTIEDMWGGDIITAAISHVAASTAPEHLMMTPFMNDLTDGHVAGYRPRSSAGRGAAPAGPGLGIDVDPSLLQPLFSFSL